MEEKTVKHISSLFLKQFTGEISEEERKELDAWVQKNPENQAWLEQKNELNFVVDDHRNSSLVKDSEEAWVELERKMDKKSRSYRRRIIRYSSVAAAIVIVALCSILFMLKEQENVSGETPKDVHKSALISLLVDGQRDSVRLNIDKNIHIELAGVRNEANTLIYDTEKGEGNEIEYHTLYVGKGGEYKVILPDGSVVWLNSESSLRYPTRFSGKRREVELQGQGFFEVERDEQMPFEVKSGDLRVEVLGTSFDIMNYANEKQARVTLASGKLRVGNGERAMVIVPDQQVEIENRELHVRQVDVRYYTSWMGDLFLFDEEPLDRVVRKLARWYDRDFKFEDSTLVKTRFSGALPKYDDISKAFELLEMTTKVKFIIQEDVILIVRRE